VDPGEQFLDGERFGHVVIDPVVAAAGPVGNRVAGGEENDGGRTACCVQPFEDLTAVQDGQVHVENDEDGLGFGDSGQRG
jgi:hypothetical protein